MINCSHYFSLSVCNEYHLDLLNVKKALNFNKTIEHCWTTKKLLNFHFLSRRRATHKRVQFQRIITENNSTQHKLTKDVQKHPKFNLMVNLSFLLLFFFLLALLLFRLIQRLSIFTALTKSVYYKIVVAAGGCCDCYFFFHYALDAKVYIYAISSWTLLGKWCDYFKRFFFFFFPLLLLFIYFFRSVKFAVDMLF